MAVKLMSPAGTLVEASESLAGRLSKFGWKPALDQAAATVDGDAPGKSASRKVWADYAESLGFDTDGLTKAQIIDAVG